MDKEEILELLDEVVDRLEGPALDLFNTFVTYHRTIAVVGLVAGVIALIIAAVSVPKAYKAFRDDDRTGRYTYNWTHQQVFWTWAAVIAGVFGLISTFGNVAGVLVPEIFALRDLVPGL